MLLCGYQRSAMLSAYAPFVLFWFGQHCAFYYMPIELSSSTVASTAEETHS